MPCLENCNFIFWKSCWLSQHDQNRPSGWFGAYFFGMKRGGERGWMKPPLPFSNKGILEILLVLLFVVGISSHPVLFLDPFGEVDLVDVGAGGGYGLPPPLTGVMVSCGGARIWAHVGFMGWLEPPTHTEKRWSWRKGTCIISTCPGYWEECLGGCEVGRPHTASSTSLPV